jgi:hypothetical protein
MGMLRRELKSMSATPGRAAWEEECRIAHSIVEPKGSVEGTPDPANQQDTSKLMVTLRACGVTHTIR